MIRFCSHNSQERVPLTWGWAGGRRLSLFPSVFHSPGEGRAPGSRTSGRGSPKGPHVRSLRSSVSSLGSGLRAHFPAAVDLTSSLGPWGSLAITSGQQHLTACSWGCLSRIWKWQSGLFWLMSCFLCPKAITTHLEGKKNSVFYCVTYAALLKIYSFSVFFFEGFTYSR